MSRLVGHPEDWFVNGIIIVKVYNKLGPLNYLKT